MTLVWRPGFQFDADASTYIEAVEVADTQALETGVRYAINDFVIGCKNDGIWNAIKASCILAGARTLNGALVPLVGTAPTNFNFVAGDYNRETGLVGDGTTKYLDSNRNNNADPQDNQHLAAWASESLGFKHYMGTLYSITGTSNISHVGFRSRTTVAETVPITPQENFNALSRNNASNFEVRVANTSTIGTFSSNLPADQSITIFGQHPTILTPSRLAFYSIGESLDLAALDTRVSTLITAIGAAIP